jgi:putative ABC transport system permease protein
MLNATIKSLLARKLRLLLASFSVLLGITFVSGAFVLTDSLGKVFDNVFATASAGNSVTVQGVNALGGGSTDEREPVPQSVLDTASKVAGVQLAVGDVQQEVTLTLPSGKAFTSSGPPIFGTSYNAGAPQEALKLVAGKAPVGHDQVMIDAHTVAKAHLKLGDEVGVTGSGEKQTATVVGVSRFGSTDSLAGATFVSFDAASALAVIGSTGWDELSLAAEPGVSNEQLQKRVAAVLPKGYEALTAQQAADQKADSIKQGLKFFNIFLQVFAGIALFVGMFLIFNTFSMLVAQRARELALMRALGASRAQVLRSVLMESLVVGLISSLGGFGAGVLLAKGFRSLMNALGLEIPNGATVVELRTFIVCLVVGVSVTVIAAMVPARRASRVAPVQAMRESGPAEERSLVRRTTGGAVVVVLGALALVAGLSQGTLPLLGLGAVLSFIGVTIVSPVFARPVVGVLALPFTRFGVAGVLGRGNAMRSPRRTATTAAALMIGLALVAAISTLGASAKKSVVATVEQSLGADYVLHTDQYSDFSGATVTALKSKSELAEVAAFRVDQANVADKERQDVQSVDAKALQAVLKLEVLKGDLDHLSTGQLALSRTTAKGLKATVGSTLDVTWSKTGKHPYTVAAIYANNQFAGSYLVSEKDFSDNVTKTKVVVIAVKASSDVTPAQSRAAITSALADYPNVKVEDQAEFVRAQGNQIDSFLNVLTGLLVLSVLIAMLGIINTLALSVVERTRELGLLRAVGVQRKQLKRMIRVESVVIAVFGALLGVAVGLAFGYAFVSALHDEGITDFAIPWARILIVLVVAGLGGVLAAAFPARRAAKLKVLDAIATA